MKRITRTMNKAVKGEKVYYLTDEELKYAESLGIEYDSVKRVKTSVPMEEFLKIADVKEVE